VKRTQIYLEEDLDRDLRKVAAAEGRSAAAIIRDAVRRYLRDARQGGPYDALLDIVGRFSGGPGDAAVEHDHYLYGAPKKKRGANLR
jgi:hypothetical protein